MNDKRDAVPDKYILASNIEKLGHPIKEIRERALHNIASKIKNGIPFDNDLARTKELFIKLFHWFLFEPCSHECLVFSLLKCIVKSNAGQTVINHCGKQFILNELDKIECYIDPQYYTYLKELHEILKSQNGLIVPPLESTIPLSYRSNGSCNYSPFVGSTASTIEGYIHKEQSQEQCDGKKQSYIFENEILNNENDNTTSEIEDVFTSLPNYYTLKFQPLIESDKHVLESIESSLEHRRSSNILQSCEFFTNVLLHDFPGEIFLQRPKIIYIFQNLLINNSSSKIKNAVLECLYHLTKTLQVRINYDNDPTMINSKLEIMSKFHSESYSQISSKQNTANTVIFESEETIKTLTHNQLPIPNYCISLLETVLKIMYSKEQSTEVNMTLNKIAHNCLKLLTELEKLLKLSMKNQIYSSPQTPRISKITKIFNEVLLEYGDAVEYFRLESSLSENKLYLRAIYLYMLHNIASILETFVPISITKAVLPRNLKNALATSLVDLSLNRLYPKTHDVLFEYVESFSDDDEGLQKYKLVKQICNGISATVKLLENHKSLKFIECLELMKTSLSSLAFHCSIELINLFVNMCSDHLINYYENSNILSTVEEIVLKLLAHHSQTIQEEMFKICQKKVIDYVSPQSGTTRSAVLGSEILFIVSTKVFNELALFGFTSTNTLVQNSAEDILIYILKCKDLVAENLWNRIIQCLIPSLPILCCHSDKTTTLGRCVINFVEPDTANCNFIPAVIVIKCNTQFLFSKDTYLREEAFSRLCWFIANQENSRGLLPRFNSLYDKSLVNACKLTQVNDVNKTRHSEHFYQPSSLQQVLEVLKSTNIEPVIRRSALNQVSVMMEDSLLHQIFCDLGGVEVVQDIMKSALMERDYRDYPDAIMPIASILKNLCFYSSSIREKLSTDITVFYFILRGLFLFFTEERMKQDATTLLFLLIFKDFVKGTPSKSNFSIPELIFKNMNIPFVSAVHLKSSEYTAANIRESPLLDRWCLNAIQVQWNAEIFGGFEELIKWKSVNYDKLKVEMEDILKMDQYTLQLIKASSIQFCLANNLTIVQNGTSHINVMEAVDNLALYIGLYYVSKRNFDENMLLSQPWEQSFSRFLKTLPSSLDDGSLLQRIINFVATIIPLYKNSDTCWITLLLKDPCQVILDLLCENKTKDKLVQDLLNLITTCVIQEQRYLDCYSFSKTNKNGESSWEHVIKIITKNLRSSNSQHFYKLAHLDSLLLCLLHLTATLGWSNSKSDVQPKDIIVQLITELCEMIDTFHYGKGISASVSVMGLSITRNVVLILNHLLAELQFCRVKNWESCFLDDNNSLKKYLALWTSRDVVLRAAVLHLFNGFLSSPKLVLDIINYAEIENGNIWEMAVTILIDHQEASIVREYAAQILISLTYEVGLNVNHKSANVKKGDTIDVLYLLEERDFYNNLEYMLNSLFTLKSAGNTELCDLKYFEDNYSENTSNKIDEGITTPGLTKSVFIFLCNTINIAPDEIISKLHDQGLVKLIFRTLCNPSISIEDTRQLSLYCDILEMNTSVCTLLKQMSRFNSLCIGTILHTNDCLHTLFSLLNTKIYYTHFPELLYLRNKLWTEIFNLFSNIMECITSCERTSHMLLTEVNEIFSNTITSTGADIFFDAVMESLCSIGSKELQNASLQFLTCLMKIEIYRIFNTKGNETHTFQYILDNIEMSRSTYILNNEGTESNDPNQLLVQSDNKKKVENSESFKMNLLEEIYFNKLIKGKSDLLESIEINFTENNKGTVVAAEICKILLFLYDVCDVQISRDNIYIKKKCLVICALSGLLCISKEAKMCALNCNFLMVIIKQLKECHIKLSLESVDCLRRMQDKKRIHPILKDINSLIGLLMNFMINEDSVKEIATRLNLADIIHKLWIWFLVENMYLVDVLKLLCVYTTNCIQACQTMPLTSSIAGSGPKKSPSNICLLHAIVSLITREMDQMSKTRTLSCLKLSFSILQNCCEVLDCRVLLSKSHLFDSVTRLHPVLTKRQKPWDDVEILWLEFVETFTNYPEGQMIVVKNNDVFEFVLTSTVGPRLTNRETAVRILRNISFYQPNKSKLLSSNEFLRILKSKLQNGTCDEIKVVIVIVWSLSVNYQKAKLIFKSMQLDMMIENVLRKYQLIKEENTLSHSDFDNICHVLDILRQNDKAR